MSDAQPSHRFTSRNPTARRLFSRVITPAAPAEGALLLMKEQSEKAGASEIYVGKPESRIELYRLVTSRIWMTWRWAGEQPQDFRVRAAVLGQGKEETHCGHDWCGIQPAHARQTGLADYKWFPVSTEDQPTETQRLMAR